MEAKVVSDTQHATRNTASKGIHRNNDHGRITVLHAACRIHEGMACISAQATQGRTMPARAGLTAQETFLSCHARLVEVKTPDVPSPKFDARNSMSSDAMK